MADGLHLQIADPAERENLSAFVNRALQLDEGAVIRLHRRSTPGILTAWTATGFGVLAARTIRADLEVPDATVAAHVLRDGLASVAAAAGRAGAEESSGYGGVTTTPSAPASSARDPLDAPHDQAEPAQAPGGAGPSAGLVAVGYSMDSAWRGALPPENGFSHVDDVPASMLLELARRGAEVAKHHSGPQGPPRSLLDQEVLTVTPGGASFARRPLTIPMRVVFALAAMGFAPDPAPDAELVRVRATAVWLRLDARFGSVAQRRDGGLALTVQ